MAKSRQTFNKKENEKKKLKKRQEKIEKKEIRKENSSKGQGLEDMLAYVDEFGNLSATPPDRETKKRMVNAADIQVSVAKNVNNGEEELKKGKVTFFNTSKGYGFIKADGMLTNVFVHEKELTEPIKENDKVSFEIQKTPKGLSAINVKVIK